MDLLNALGASKKFFTYLLPCFLLENQKDQNFELLAFKKNETFSFFSWASLSSF
jgi:hypothetical protein